jgi:glycerol-3-phosphate dehydrogenase
MDGRADRAGGIVDLAIIGGGINGTGLARDAAGRGFSVRLVEQGDLGGATSSASTKLIHGGLRYLEHWAFRLVREALREREVLWRIAPHIIWPLRFVLPHRPGLRPAWMLRLGLFLYDHLGGRTALPGTATLDLRTDPAGAPLAPGLVRGFAYPDCWVEDNRLVVLNARDAAAHGAVIETRTRCLDARREGGAWTVTVADADGGGRRSFRARILVNAAGPWVAEVLSKVVRVRSPAAIRLVQGSHIVVPRLYDHDACYILQNSDRRIVFAIPYEGDFTLLGTTDRDWRGDPAQVTATPDEITYLCAAANAWFRKPVTPADVVWTYSGIRPLYDDGATAAQEATRDYVLARDGAPSEPALLSIFGGKITTYRRLAEAALDALARDLPARSGKPKGWTGREPLPGGDFPAEGFDALVSSLLSARPWLPAPLARRLARAYGTEAERLLDGAASLSDLGRDFGSGLTEAELCFLARNEWARTGEDVLWRRTKLGLKLTEAQRAAVDRAMAGAGPA